MPRYSCRSLGPLCFLGLAAGAGLHAQTASLPAVEIRVVSGTALEFRARQQLERILATWDLSPWLFTRTIQIQTQVIPHSHPVLTLNTRHLDNDTAQVATFIHEQLHWFLVRHQGATDSAMADLEQLYPSAPAGPPEGARDRASTYLHLLVCLLEWRGMRDVFGDAIAHRTLRGWQHYSWIYREVLERPEPIARVLEKYSLDRPDARQ